MANENWIKDEEWIKDGVWIKDELYKDRGPEYLTKSR